MGRDEERGVGAGIEIIAVIPVGSFCQNPEMVVYNSELLL
jgi:hypothetical protein